MATRATRKAKLPAQRRSPSTLQTYRAKRRFAETPEPKGAKGRKAGWRYVIQKHDATRLHYDFRLELDGVLKSWAVTRGPSLNPKDKRLAIRTEDHPVDYGSFEGVIPPGNYGAGTVMLWDRGTWEPIGDPHKGLEAGKLVFRLHGERLRGEWAMIRLRTRKAERQEPWLLIKAADEQADDDRDLLTEFDTSVETARDLPAIAADETSRVHVSNRAAKKRPAPRRPSKRKRGALPALVEPELATLVDDVPAGEKWLFEIKFDGYRILTAASGDEVRCYTRNGLDWTARFGSLPDAIANLDLDRALLDGELVAIDEDGRSNFSALQEALSQGGTGLSYFVFDLLFAGGKDLRPLPLIERKERLKTLLGSAGKQGPVFLSDHVRADGRSMLRTLRKKGFEGIIAKRADRPYRSGRGRDWLKIKCAFEQEFIVVGYTLSEKNRPFSSLLLAVNEKGTLRYVGGVGTGFGAREFADLSRRFKRLARKSPPFEGPVPTAVRRRARWLEPKLVAQIGFAGFTGDGQVRQARYLGLRPDKAPSAVHREQPKPLQEVVA
jgi:bifunctional non-homologous end joining protein LigD